MAIRTERLKEVIRETSAEFIQRELNDPRLGFCTVTHVDLASDLSFATIYVSVLGEEPQKRTTMRCLNDARGLLQSRIAKALKTRTTPHIKIELDESIERSFRILEKIKEARASDPDHGSSAAENPEVEDTADETAEEDQDGGEEEAAEAPKKPAKAPRARKKAKPAPEEDA